jgi:hypothetical protein
MCSAMARTRSGLRSPSELGKLGAQHLVHATSSKIDVIQAEVARNGAANFRRAYGLWKSP